MSAVSSKLTKMERVQKLDRRRVDEDRRVRDLSAFIHVTLPSNKSEEAPNEIHIEFAVLDEKVRGSIGQAILVTVSNSKKHLV